MFIYKRHDFLTFCWNDIDLGHNFMYAEWFNVECFKNFKNIFFTIFLLNIMLFHHDHIFFNARTNWEEFFMRKACKIFSQVALLAKLTGKTNTKIENKQIKNFVGSKKLTTVC